MVKTKASFNKKSTYAAFFYFLCLLSWCIPSFANFPEYMSGRCQDDKCGTLKDPNYCDAFSALQKATELLRDGVDIFAGVGLTKVMKSYRELKRANNLLTFEAMAISERNKSLIQLEAARRAQARKEILQCGNLKIQPDKQGKHLIDHKNYILSDRKSILEHPNPQKLIDEFAGKGMKAKRSTTRCSRIPRNR
jgi:hypothetical protein